jgi:hypothetical protein
VRHFDPVSQVHAASEPEPCAVACSRVPVDGSLPRLTKRCQNRLSSGSPFLAAFWVARTRAQKARMSVKTAAQEVDDIALLSLKPAKEGHEQEME